MHAKFKKCGWKVKTRRRQLERRQHADTKRGKVTLKLRRLRVQETESTSADKGQKLYSRGGLL